MAGCTALAIALTPPGMPAGRPPAEPSPANSSTITLPLRYHYRNLIPGFEKLVAYRPGDKQIAGVPE